jgi:hypothetical protein
VSLEKQKTSVPSTAVLKAKKQPLKTKPQEEVQAPPVKKVRRVLPEHEGRYKITMPSGSTPRTQRILDKQGLCKYYPKRNGTVLSVSLDTHFTVVCFTVTQKKKTVFDRLGDGSVTSTTESEVPSITITGLGLNIVKTASSSSEKVTGIT